MKPAAFDYVAPASLADALSVLSRYGDDAKVLAGGQSLVPMMALRLAAPAVLVDLNRAQGLAGIEVDEATMTVGAMTRHRDVLDHPELRWRCPMIPEAVAEIGHVSIRNRGTVGGSLAHADPAAEWGALALALDAEIEAVGPAGERLIPASELFVTYFTSSLQPDEIIRRVRFRLPAGDRSGSAFVEVARQHGDFALAGAAAWLTLDGDWIVADARVALIGVADVPIRSRLAEQALAGQRPTDAVIAQAAASMDAEIRPPDDVHGSAKVRRMVARAVLERALTRARARAEGADADQT